MKKTLFIVASLFLSVGCKGPVDEVISDLEGWKARMCACKDKACVEKVDADFEKYEDKMMAKLKGIDKDDVEKDQIEKFKSLEKGYRTCKEKYETP